ncbi:MAG: transposase [Pseudomonadota bacterium]
MSRSEKHTYTKEFRAEAVKLVLEQGMSLEEAGASLALPKGTLANWAAAARRGDGAAAVPGGRSVAELEAEVTRLRKELANANVEVEILKKSHRVLCTGVAAQYAQVKAMRPDFPVERLCRAFDVSRSGFYASLRAPSAPRAQQDAVLKVAI